MLVPNLLRLHRRFIDRTRLLRDPYLAAVQKTAARNRISEEAAVKSTASGVFLEQPGCWLVNELAVFDALHTEQDRADLSR